MALLYTESSTPSGPLPLAVLQIAKMK